MNLRDLQYLVSVAEHCHFGKAAKESHVSQPTLSMQLKKLEEYLGVQLIERTNKQVMMTSIGQEIALRARQILEDVTDLREAAKAAQDPFIGDFRLGAFPTLAPYALPLVVPPIHKKLPKLRLLLIEEKTEVLLERLRAGTIDAALLALPILGDGLETIPLFDDPFLLAVPEGHKLSRQTTINLNDIQNEQLLLLEDGHCLRSQALEVCRLMGASESQDFRATSLETLRQMVVANVGITLIPKLAVKKDQGIVYIPFNDPVPLRSIAMVFRKTSARKSCIETLVKCITEAVV